MTESVKEEQKKFNVTLAKSFTTPDITVSTFLDGLKGVKEHEIISIPIVWHNLGKEKHSEVEKAAKAAGITINFPQTLGNGKSSTAYMTGKLSDVKAFTIAKASKQTKAGGGAGLKLKHADALRELNKQSSGGMDVDTMSDIYSEVEDVASTDVSVAPVKQEEPEDKKLITKSSGQQDKGKPPDSQEYVGEMDAGLTKDDKGFTIKLNDRREVTPGPAVASAVPVPSSSGTMVRQMMSDYAELSEEQKLAKTQKESEEWAKEKRKEEMSKDKEKTKPMTMAKLKKLIRTLPPDTSLSAIEKLIDEGKNMSKTYIERIKGLDAKRAEILSGIDNQLEKSKYDELVNKYVDESRKVVDEKSKTAVAAKLDAVSKIVNNLKNAFAMRYRKDRGYASDDHSERVETQNFMTQFFNDVSRVGNDIDAAELAKKPIVKSARVAPKKESKEEKKEREAQEKVIEDARVVEEKKTIKAYVDESSYAKAAYDDVKAHGRYKVTDKRIKPVFIEGKEQLLFDDVPLSSLATSDPRYAAMLERTVAQQKENAKMSSGLLVEGGDRGVNQKPSRKLPKPSKKLLKKGRKKKVIAEEGQVKQPKRRYTKGAGSKRVVIAPQRPISSVSFNTSPWSGGWNAGSFAYNI